MFSRMFNKMQRKTKSDSSPINPEKLSGKDTRKYEDDNLQYDRRISSTESHGRFFERRRQYPEDHYEYDRSGDDPGLILIFNQEYFDCNMEPREGSSKDVKDITTCFGRLGFNIKKENIFENLSRDEIFSKVDKVLESDLSQFNSLLVFILSHGGNCNSIYSRTRNFQLEHLLIKFENCDALRGKPKMFVIQACKGKEKTQLLDAKKNVLLVPLSTFENIYHDMVIVYSTIEGRTSFRHTDYGSWLIQEICRNFTAYGRRDDVISLLSRVIKCICTNYYFLADPKSEVQKQIPVVVSSLSSKFYLNTNKDRNFMIESTRIHDNICNALSHLVEFISLKET